MNKTLFGHAHVFNAAASPSGTGAKEGVAIDRDGYRDALLHVAVTSGEGAAKAIVEHSDDGENFEEVDVQHVVAETEEVTEAGGQTQLDINLEGFKQFIRVNLEAADAVDAVATIVLGNMERNPTP